MRVDETEGLKGWLIGLAAFFTLVGLIVCYGGYVLLNSEVLKNQGIQSIIEALKVVATTFGGAAILFNVYYAAKRAKAMDDSAIAANKSAEAALDNAKAALKNAEAAQDKQITERFTKAIELLGSDNISIRLGGIYALERIAKDSKKDHWTIMEVLTAFVREKALFAKDSKKDHWTIMEVLTDFVRENALLKELKGKEIQQRQSLKIPTDIQAALTVIGQRDVEKDPKNQGLNLQYTNLDGADLSAVSLQRAFLSGASLQGAYLDKANLQGADLSAANLQGTYLNKANLQGADLIGANLQGAYLDTANLQGAYLIEANLKGADLFGANLKGASLIGANLQEADLSAANLKGANLLGANLQWANLFGANLQGANLFGANLQWANLELVQNLKQEQLETALGDSATVLPDNVERPAHWTQAE